VKILFPLPFVAQTGSDPTHDCHHFDKKNSIKILNGSKKKFYRQAGDQRSTGHYFLLL